MSKREDTDYLLDISEAISRIESYIEKLNYSQFSTDRKTQDAVIRNLEIIGEAAKNISELFKNKYSHIRWSKIVGMRNLLIHQYFGVNIDVVWTICQNELPNLFLQIKQIVKNG